MLHIFVSKKKTKIRRIIKILFFKKLLQFNSIKIYDATHNFPRDTKTIL